MSVAFFMYFGFRHQRNWSPRYSWNIVESGVKHQNQNSDFDSAKFIKMFIFKDNNNVGGKLYSVIVYFILQQTKQPVVGFVPSNGEG